MNHFTSSLEGGTVQSKWNQRPDRSRSPDLSTGKLHVLQVTSPS